MLGSWIDAALKDAKRDYSMLDHMVDISKRGETMAVLGIIDDNYENTSYVNWVFDSNYRKGEWLRKGQDLVIMNITFDRNYKYKYRWKVFLTTIGKSWNHTPPSETMT